MDPRRRLQVAKASNPSLRVATAPKQQLSVAKVNTPTISGVSGAAPKPAPAPRSFLQNVNDFTASANEQFLGNTIREGVNLVNWVGSGFNKDVAAQKTDEFLRSTGQTDANGNFNLTKGVDRNSTAAKVGSAVGTGEKLATDIVQMAIPAGAATKVATKLPWFANTLSKIRAVGPGGKLASRIVAEVPGSLAATGVNTLQLGAKGEDQDIAKSAGIGTLTDLSIPVAGKVFGKLVNPLKSLFKGKNVFSSIANDTGVTSVAEKIRTIFPNIDEQRLSEVSTYIASETDPKTVKEVIKELAVDPTLGVSDDMAKLLQKEGITAVNKQSTPYGAEFDPNTGTINISDKSNATVANIYHELGHNTFINKLTPEERAAFLEVQGAASKQAKGRAGYTPEDIASEDFSDFMRKALEGNIDEVPESVRGIIKKYSDDIVKTADELGIDLFKGATKEATKMADSVLHLPEKGVHARITADQLEFLKNEVDNIPWNATDRPHLTAGNKVTQTTKEISQEELAALSPNAGAALKKATPSEQAAQEVSQQAEAVGKAQTGTADGTVTGAGQTVTETPNSPIQNADQIIPNADPDTQKAVQEVIDSLNSAERSNVLADASRAQQKAARIQAGNAAYEVAGGGEAGVRAKLAKLRGQYDRPGFNPANVSEGTQKAILDDVESSGLRDFEKLNLQNAMRKVWGAKEGVPTKGEINMIRKYFGKEGDDMGDLIEQGVESTGKDWKEWTQDIAGIPRAAMASFDFSMGGRQGALVAARSFPEWSNSIKESVKYATDTKYFQKEMENIARSDAFETINDKMGIRLPAVYDASDEIMASAHILEKIPVYGKGISASDRAYSGGLTKLRYNLAKTWIDGEGGVDAFLKNHSEKELKDIGEVINTSTGSGGKPGGFTEKNMNILATSLFAPRLWASRLNMINPTYYARLSGPARQRAAENLASFAAVAGSVVGLAHAAGADIELDPRSADFLKIKVGNTRYDVLAGLQQNLVFAARMITGEKKSSTDGEIATLGDGYGKPTRFDLAIDMGNNKLNPLLGYVVKLLRSGQSDSKNPLVREDRFGQDFNLASDAVNLGIPLNVQSTYETAKDQGVSGDKTADDNALKVAKAAGMNLPGFFGVSVQTYSAPKKDGKDSKNSDSKDKIELPDGIKSEPAKAFYTKYKSMKTDKRDEYLTGPPDDNAKLITELLNKDRTKGLEKFKPSNELAKLYADYEKDINSHPEYSSVEKQKKARYFQRNAYKLNFSGKVQSLYSSGSGTDLYNAIDAGLVSKKNLDEAVRLDTELYNAGLSGTLQFSKTFRRNYGYTVPGSSGGSRSRGGGSRGGSSTAKSRAYLSAYLPSTSGSTSAGSKPQFSTKSRSPKANFQGVKLPTKSGKKVTIKL